MNRFLLIAIVLISFNLLFSQDFIIKAKYIYTMEEELGVIKDGYVVIENQKIREVTTEIKPEKYKNFKKIEAHSVTPGFVDAHTYAGLSGAYNIPADQDMNERSNPITPELRAIDGFNPEELLIRYLRENGVTTVHVTPGPANPIAGQSAIFKTYGNTVPEVVINDYFGMMFILGEFPKNQYGKGRKAPTTRMATAAMIREMLLKAREYEQKMQTEEYSHKRNLKLEALIPVLNRKKYAIFHCERRDDIYTAIRIAREFNLKYILDGVSEGYLMAEDLKSAGIPIFANPTSLRPATFETRNAHFQAPLVYQKHGLLFAITSGFEGYVPKTHVIPLEAQIAYGWGLNRWDALKAVTINPAKILRLESRIGSIREGKDADLVLWDNDPMEYVSLVTRVFINGILVVQQE